MPPTTRNIALLCNPLAGAGKASQLAKNTLARLDQLSLSSTLFAETWPAHFEGFTDAWIFGGDGTLHYFVNKYPGIKLPLVIFNGGTGNDFHWLLYGKLTEEQQFNIALNGIVKPFDLGVCNDRYFINGVGIGFEGEVAKALTGKKKLPGKTSFLFTILKKIFSYRSRNYDVWVKRGSLSLSKGERVSGGRKLLIDAANGCRAGGGFHVAPESKADDGLLDLVMVKALSPLARLRYLPVIEKGKHLGLGFIEHLKTNSLLISSDEKIQYHLDGEYYEDTELRIGILPGQLLFRV